MGCGSGTTPPRRPPPADEDDPRPCPGGVERTKQCELVGGAGLRRRGNKAVGIGGVSRFRRTAANQSSHGFKRKHDKFSRTTTICRDPSRQQGERATPPRHLHVLDPLTQAPCALLTSTCVIPDFQCMRPLAPATADVRLTQIKKAKQFV